MITTNNDKTKVVSLSNFPKQQEKNVSLVVQNFLCTFYAEIGGITIIQMDKSLTICFKHKGIILYH